MKQRNPAAVFFLSLITLGIYSIVWEVKTKNELKSLGADIPTAWLIIVPLANLYWIWKYAVGVEQVSKGRISAVLALILLLLLSIVGYAILQSEFNKLGSQPMAAGGFTPSPSPLPGQPTPPGAPTAPVPPTPIPPTGPTPPTPPIPSPPQTPPSI